ncbi:tetratricopeptide repeat protein [Roseobacteraceae bacterium S113]
MSAIGHQIKHGVAALCAIVMFSIPLQAEESELLQQLQGAEAIQAKRIEQELITLWSRSGSASMDFLLKRGRDAIEVRDWRLAIEHLTALTDHAPDFAEGYHSRAIAYFRAERFGPAIADLETALTLNPNHFGAIRGLATIFESLGDAKRAHAAYSLVLELHPHDAQAQEGLERTQLRAFGQAL